jgi:hypothetical protein
MPAYASNAVDAVLLWAQGLQSQRLSLGSYDQDASALYLTIKSMQPPLALSAPFLNFDASADVLGRLAVVNLQPSQALAANVTSASSPPQYVTVGDFSSIAGMISMSGQVRFALDGPAPSDGTLQNRVAHLGMIMPFTNNGVELEGIAWKQVTCGAKLAVSHVNSGDETIVPGLRALITNLQRLDSSIYDTGCIMGLGSKHPFHSCHPAITHMAMARLLCADSASPGLFSYRQMVQAGAHAMIGAARSAVSMPLAQLGALDVMPQCSYWSSSPSLSDTQLYPYCASLLVCPESHKSFTSTCSLAAYALALRRMPCVLRSQSGVHTHRTPSRPRCCRA